jgi:hypothetical protein
MVALTFNARTGAWHWVLLALSAFVVLVVYYFSLGIPAY